MNTVQLLGRIGKSPEIRYAQSGTAVCNFSLATSEKVKGEDKTQWHRLVAFGKTAELIEKYCNKGDQLAVEGKIQYGSYEKDGQTIYTTDILVNRIHFVSSKSKFSQEPQDRQGQGYNPNQQQTQGGYQDSQLVDGDIPF